MRLISLHSAVVAAVFWFQFPRSPRESSDQRRGCRRHGGACRGCERAVQSGFGKQLRSVTTARSIPIPLRVGVLRITA